MEVEFGVRIGLQPSFASLMSVAVQIAEKNPSATSFIDGADKRKRKSPKKVSSETVSKRLKLIEASKIECPIIKYPTAIRMQNVEGFLLNLEERNLHLGSRSNACIVKSFTVKNFKQEHAYNAASSEMLDPKEKRFETENSESAQEAKKN